MQKRALAISAVVLVTSALIAGLAVLYAWQALGASGVSTRPGEATTRPDTRRADTIVGVVALLGLLQTVGLTGLAYRLSTARAHPAPAPAAPAPAARSQDDEVALAIVARHATDFILLTDPAGRIDWANDAFLRAHGYTLADVQEQRAWAVLHGPATPLDAVDAMRSAFASGRACQVETVSYTRARDPLWVSLQVQPLRDAADQVTQFVITARDITTERAAREALHRSEHQYRRLVEQVDQVIFQTDAQGRWTFLNRAWRELTGFEIDATLGQQVTSLLHPDDRLDAQRFCHALLEGRQDECRIEVRFITSRGAVCWTDLRARTVFDQGRLIGITGSLTDVTARRLVQQELERARTAAERASTAKSEFLRSMSHEMRTPLNGVLGLLELLAGTTLSAQQVRYVSVARASATHLSTLINDILDLSRLESGGLQLERLLFDLPDLVESSLDVVAPQATAKALRLSCTVTPDVPTWVLGDPGRIRQVLVNLLVNAVKFTERGDVHLRADAQVDLLTRRATLRLEVHDTGIGIPAEQLERLFLPFSPGDASTTRRHSGTGLGLIICKRLVDAMQGTIAVTSVERAGATFTVTLPIDVADAATVEAQRSADVPLRALAVLPSDAEREDVRRLLEGWRLDAAVVADCDTAWGHVEATTGSRWRFGVVLLDSDAPGAGAFARRLRTLLPEPGLVWITPEHGRLPAEITGLRERIARPLKAAALFDALMQAAVGAAAPVPEGNRGAVFARALRVLVAEDHDVNQMVIRELLLGLGCEVDVVADGQAAVDAMLARPYDAVLMDCQMPVLDGLEATRRLRRAQRAGQTTHAPRIVALTANATDEDRQACLDAGMDAYLTKPVRGTILQRTLQRLLVETAASPETPVGGELDDARPSDGPPIEAAGIEAPDAEDILDPAEVLLRCNNNGDLGARMLQLFAETLPAELEALEAAAAADDREALGRIAHKMRGAAATLAAARLAGAISGVELFLKYGDGGPLPDLLADVRHETALLLGVVPQIVRRLDEPAASSRS